jgi:hypothetical protein
MHTIRWTLGALFATLGTYYCVLSMLTLARLPRVTADWIARSGDVDFKHDYRFFMVGIAVGSVLAGVFGYRSAVQGLRAARGGRESWPGLALAAPFLHWFWFLFRRIGAGVLDREAQEMVMRNNALWFGAICFAYLVMWMVMRQGHSAKPASPTRRYRSAWHFGAWRPRRLPRGFLAARW